MNKLKDKSKKRMEHSNKLLEEYKAINDKIDTNIEKTKIVRAPCEINMLIESTNELIKRSNNCEKTMYFQIMLKNLIRLINLKKRSKKGINKSKELLKSYKVNNDIASTLIKRLKTINEYDDLNKKGVG